MKVAIMICLLHVLTIRVYLGTVDDTSLPTPAEQLSTHLQTLEVRRALEIMEPEYLEELQDMLHRIYHETTQNEDMDVLDRIAHFLSYHGLGLKYSRRLPPIQEEKPIDYLAEYESLIGEPLERDAPGEYISSLDICSAHIRRQKQMKRPLRQGHHD